MILAHGGLLSSQGLSLTQSTRLHLLFTKEIDIHLGSLRWHAATLLQIHRPKHATSCEHSYSNHPQGFDVIVRPAFAVWERPADIAG